jgi:hypothetical protein
MEQGTGRVPISALRCYTAARVAEARRWIDEEKKYCFRSCLVKVRRRGRELVSRRINVESGVTRPFFSIKCLSTCLSSVL